MANGPQVFNVQSYGATPGQDCTAAFQAAIDAAGASRNSAVVYVPSSDSPYLFSAPVYLDFNNVGIRGEGDSSVLSSLACFPPFNQEGQAGGGDCRMARWGAA